MVEPYLNQVGGKVDNDVSLFTGGLNTYTDKAFLEADQMPYVMNMTMRQPPAIQTRNSRMTLANYMTNQQLPWNSGEITKMWAYNQDLIYFIRKRDELTYDLCLLKKDGTSYDYDVIHTDTAGNYADVYFCYGRTDTDEFLYLGSETFKAKMILGAENPLDQYYDSYTDHFGIPCWHKSRLFLLRPSKGEIEWSNTFAPDNFLIGPDDPDTPTYYGDSGVLPISSQNGRGNLTGLVSFDDKLIVFCQHSVHAIYGHSGEASDANYFQVVDLLGHIGCLSQDHIAVSGGRLYWYGDDKQIYEYTGASINMLSRPGKTRNSTLAIGGIDNVLNRLAVTKLAATSNTLYVDTDEGFMFVFDAYNRVWWCEDGGFATIANYSQSVDNLLMATKEGDILTYDFWGGSIGRDELYDWETSAPEFKNIEFEFHTRVYGAEGTDLRKTLSEVWFQMFCANGFGKVYINDVWCDTDKWKDHLENTVKSTERYKEIGSFATNGTRGDLAYYQPQTYEQRHFIVEKMYGQRLNTFQVVVKGELFAKFFIMKREWRAR